jgi:signal transduction histidine kinase
MSSKQIFMIVTIVAAFSVVMIATPVMAQNIGDHR